VLTEVLPAAPAESLTPDRPTATGTSGNEPFSYALDGHEGELALHAGRRVEITGSLAEPPAASAPASDRRSTPASLRRFQVGSIKELALDCAPKSD
jgi:hypothetical protein